MNDNDLLNIFITPERATQIQQRLGLLRPSFQQAISNGADPSTFSTKNKQKKEITYQPSYQGEIKDANYEKYKKSLAFYGITNGLGQMTNISDQYRSTPSFANFIGKDVPLSMGMSGSFIAAPQTALYGVGTSFIGSKIGSTIGDRYENKEAGKLIGSFIAPIVASGFNGAILPSVRRTFANEFGNSFGYDQLYRILPFTKTILKGGANKYPKIVQNKETGDYVAIVTENGKTKLYDNNNPSDIARIQATSKYAGALDSETPFYLKNNNGTYQYNLEETPHSQMGLFRNRKGSESLRSAKQNGYQVSGDFIGNNGGSVGLRYDGQFLGENGELYDKFLMRDVWDLQPISAFTNKIGSRLKYTKTFLPEKIAYPLGDILQKVGNSRIINREVGRIIGGKPFTLEHPFAVKASLVDNPKTIPMEFQLKGNTINLFKNGFIPSVKYSTPYEVRLDMPFDFTRIQKNMVYPMFNYEAIKNRTKSVINK